MKNTDSWRISRRVILGGGLAGLARAALAKAPFHSGRPRPRPRLQSAVRSAPEAGSALGKSDDLVAAARLNGKVAFAVADVETGKVLAGRQPQLALPPASVTKTITSLYAIATLGGEHRFRTRLIGTGTLVDGRLDGDLILVGGGDPTLDTDALAQMAAALKARGVRTLTGRYRVWSGALPFISRIDGSQPDQVGFDPAVSGLNLNFNRVHFEWKRSGGRYQVILDAPGLKSRPQVETVRMRVVDRAYPVYTYASDGQRENWSVARSALRGHGARWLPVRQPDLYAGDVFRALARAEGIMLPVAERVAELPQGQLLAEWSSQDLLTILRYMLKYSTNLTAEVVGLAASEARGDKVTSLQASAAVMTAWLIATYGTRQTRFVDHSGLEDRSRVSPQDMVTTLVSAASGGPLPALLKKVRMRDARGRIDRKNPLSVVAKSGTLNFVSNLVGYASAPSGRKLAFAIFTADLPRRDALRPDEKVHPRGGRWWLAHARRLQRQLLARWAKSFGA